MKQTPLQKAIELINKNRDEKLQYYDLAINNVTEILQSLLPYEQEYIENAHRHGFNTLKSSNKYFKETYTNSPIEFDAKKVAEEIYCDFLSITPNSNTYFLKRCCIKALNYSHYTQTQKELILNELNKV